MEFHYFDALLHLTAVFNLACSAVHKFSDNIKPFFASTFAGYIQRKKNEFSHLILNIKDKSISTEILSTDIDNRLDTKYIEFTNICDSFLGNNDVGKRDWEYGSRFKGIYLIAGLFSLFLLFLIGGTHYFDEARLNHGVFVVNVVISSLCVIVFISTFFKNAELFSPMTSLISFILILLMYDYIYYFKHFYFDTPGIKCTIFFSISVVFIPFLLHFLRIAIEIGYVQVIIWIIMWSYKTQLKELEKERKRIADAVELIKKYQNPK